MNRTLSPAVVLRTQQGPTLRPIAIGPVAIGQSQGKSSIENHVSIPPFTWITCPVM